ncbi:MAG: hypothetical protein RIC87_24475 [Kiloniellales bacterium]
MSKEPTYAELAAAIARYVHWHLYTWEERIDLPPIQTFDTMCASYYQIPAGVLEKVGVLSPLDESGRRFVFTCEPEDCEAVAQENENCGCSFDALVVAAIELIDFTALPNREIFEALVALGVCEPGPYFYDIDEGLNDFIAVAPRNHPKRTVLAGNATYRIIGDLK